MTDDEKTAGMVLSPEIHSMAFDQTKPSHYSNIFYLSGTLSDIRIAFGTLRPARYDTTEQTVDKFDVSVTMPHAAARQLADLLDTMLKRVGK